MGLLDSINGIFEYMREKQEDKPAISVAAAVVLSISYTLLYVVPFYLSKQTRPSPTLTRDAPAVIKARLRVVVFASLLASAITVFVAHRDAKMAAREIFHFLGWWPVGWLESLKVLALLIVLFAGPLFEAGLVEGRWRDWVRLRGVAHAFTDIIGFRTFIAAPFTEEVVFRSAIIPLHIFASFSLTKLVFVTPLYFGVAHCHHLYEFRLTHPQTPLFVAVIRSVVQFAYTSVFGFFAAFVFLRTGSICAAIIAHSFCNWMGLPRFWGRVEAPVSIGPQDVHGTEMHSIGDSESLSKAKLQVAQGRLPIWWTIVYYILLVVGAFGFSRLLWPLTDSTNFIKHFFTLEDLFDLHYV